MKTGDRPIITTPGVGDARHDRYASAIDRVKDALSNGYFVEAIAIEESLIGDRLESLANEFSNGKHSYKPLGNLVYILINDYSIDLTKEQTEILNEIKDWAINRNHAIHEMGKLDSNLKETFQESYNNLQEIAEKGMPLFNKINNAIRKQRRAKAKGKVVLKCSK